MAESGAFIVQAHPYREAAYIDHIRLFPRHVHGVEIINGNQNDFVNGLAEHYANSYSLIRFAGTDNHKAGGMRIFGGMESEIPIADEQDFIRQVFSGEMKPFRLEVE